MDLGKRDTATNEPFKECVVHKEICFELFTPNWKETCIGRICM